MVESKDRRLSASAVTEELKQARRNRNATASIAVFAKLSQTPMKTRIFLDDFGAIIALDGANDDVLLRVAYEWAERIATRETSDAGDLDLHAAQAALDDLDQAINNMREVNKSLNGIEKNLETGRRAIGDMRRNVIAAAERARRALQLADVEDT